MHKIADAKGYAVLSDSDGDIPFPPAKGADLSRLSRYPISSIKIWGDPQAIRRATQDSYKPIDEAIRRFVSPPASGAPAADPKAAANAIAELGLSLLGQLGLADAAVEPSATGIVLRVGVAAKTGSDLQKALAAATLAPSALDWASQLRADEMYGYAWSMDPAVASGLYAQMMGPLFTSLGLPKDIGARATALQAKWSKAAGPRGAIGMDLDIDASAISKAKSLDSEDPAALGDFIKKMLRIRFDLLQDVKDEAGYRALIKGIATDPDYLALSKAYSDTLGISIGIKTQDKKDGAFSYGELGLDLKVVDSSKLGALDSAAGSKSSAAAAEAALAAVSSMINMRWTISNGRFVATAGDLAALKALAASKSADPSLAADPAFAAFAKTMPAKTFVVGSLSMRKMMGMVSDIMAAESGAGGSPPNALPDPSKFGSWYSYFAINAAGLAPGLEAGFMVPASDIGVLVQSGGSLFKPKASSGGV